LLRLALLLALGRLQRTRHTGTHHRLLTRRHLRVGIVRDHGGRRRAAALHRTHLLLELLIAILQLLDGAGELAQGIFDTVDAHGQIVGIAIRRRRALLLALLPALAAAEQVVEEVAAAILRMRGIDRGQNDGHDNHGSQSEAEQCARRQRGMRFIGVVFHRLIRRPGGR